MDLWLFRRRSNETVILSLFFSIMIRSVKTGTLIMNSSTKRCISLMIGWSATPEELPKVDELYCISSNYGDTQDHF